MITLYEPKVEVVWFRQAFMSDEETMSYNRAWGGTIPFPEERWQEWHDRWVGRPEGKRYYRYLRDSESGAFVGEIACHPDEEGRWLADVIVAARYRGRGFGRAGLRLLCAWAKERGIPVLRDDMALGNPALGLFLSEGFTEEYRTSEIVMLRKEL